MFLRGEDMALIGAVKPVTQEAVQPAGVDLSLAEIELLESEGVLGLEERRLPGGGKLEPRGGWWSLAPGAYRVRFSEVVEVPRGYVGFCYPRSSLLRMGATVYCAVWDPGYRGRGQALMAVWNPHGLRIEWGARVAQLVLAEVSGPVRPYRGAYMGEGLNVAVGLIGGSSGVCSL